MTIPGFPDAAPMAGLAGGILIGIAAAVMLIGVGRIAGVSGIAARAFGLSESSLPRFSAWSFLIGLPLGAFIVSALSGDPAPDFASPIYLVLAGLIVGIGTKLGSGCTSGHGVCGMSRFSQRSIVATITFMITGFATVAIMNAIGLEVLP
ncbi:YeeE/YedE thiosulfate transporter family protein [Erythrobacter sp. F6033]|uniref:YeeE/YedE family protein n=1 Tax=Erythrobacter sp. F6033 TaxID=2926401 RepID=UPI001FF54348|nr:YeeE/YedE family protein [Erythrobacter sp. F6033]